MIYAYSQIMRENSPIENVVLDLSNNDGGDADTAIFVISAFLGDGFGSLKNTMTGALATAVYNVDINLDGKFDENDRGLTGKRFLPHHDEQLLLRQPRTLRVPEFPTR